MVALGSRFFIFSCPTYLTLLVYAFMQGNEYFQDILNRMADGQPIAEVEVEVEEATGGIPLPRLREVSKPKRRHWYGEHTAGHCDGELWH